MQELSLNPNNWQQVKELFENETFEIERYWFEILHYLDDVDDFDGFLLYPLNFYDTVKDAGYYIKEFEEFTDKVKNSEFMVYALETYCIKELRQTNELLLAEAVIIFHKRIIAGEKPTEQERIELSEKANKLYLESSSWNWEKQGALYMLKKTVEENYSLINFMKQTDLYWMSEMCLENWHLVDKAIELIYPEFEAQ